MAKPCVIIIFTILGDLWLAKPSDFTNSQNAHIAIFGIILISFIGLIGAIVNPLSDDEKAKYRALLKNNNATYVFYPNKPTKLIFSDGFTCKFSKIRTWRSNMKHIWKDFK